MPCSFERAQRESADHEALPASSAGNLAEAFAAETVTGSGDTTLPLQSAADTESQLCILRKELLDLRAREQDLSVSKTYTLHRSFFLPDLWIP